MTIRVDDSKGLPVKYDFRAAPLFSMSTILPAKDGLWSSAGVELGGQQGGDAMAAAD
jgi:hypothetical protein